MMDGKLVKVESKCNTRCNDGVDRISQLPDGIIVDIMSNLTLRDAARTIVLSTRWYDLWRDIPVLYFINGESSLDEDRAKFIERVNSNVEKHKAHSLKNLTIFCNLDKSSHSAITIRFEFAFSNRIQVMHLRFARENAVGLDEFLRLRPSNLLKSSNLKSLCLSCVNVSGESIKLILRDCRLLEQLKICNAVFTSDIEVCGGATGLVLKHLEISYCSGAKSIKVSAPNLTSLKICNYTEVLLLVENAPKLVEVDIYSSRQRNTQEFCFVSQLQILNIEPFHPQDFPAKRIPTMPKLMELKVNYHGRPANLLPKLTSFIRASPLLQTFKLQVQDMEFANVEAFEHHHVREFKISGFDVDDADHMELVSFVLDNCVALRKLIIGISKTYRKLSPRPNLKTRIAKREADVEKAKQLLQPKLRYQIQLQFIVTYN